MGLEHELGLIFQDSKTIWPATQIEFLGLELDSVAMEAHLPHDKLIFLKSLLQEWSVKQIACLQEIQELAGFLQFVSQVIPCSQSFLHRIINFSMKFHSPFQKLHMAKDVKADVHWWQIFCTPWNRVRLLNPSLPSIVVHSDASGWKDIGRVCLSKFFSSRMPHRYQDRDIQFKEAFAILRAILCWGNTWDSHHVTFYCDNQAVVSWLTSGTCRSSHSMPIIRMISMMAACLYFSFSCIWIPTEENALADTASCFQFTRLFQLAPHVCRTSSTMKSQLTGLRRTLSSLDGSPSTSGMDWHPALGKHTHLVSNPTLILSESTHHSSMPLDSTFLPQNVEFWNGLHHLEIRPSCPEPLNPTSRVFVPCTLMRECPLNAASPPQFSISSEELSVSMGKKLVLPSCPSCSTSSRSLPQYLGTSTSKTTSILMQQSSLHGLDFYDVGSLQLQMDTSLIPQPTLLTCQLNLPPILGSRHTSISLCPPQKQTHFVRVFQSL
jgi:Reverse transcriptase-like